MVVLSAAIISKTGKALVARQFVDMARIRIEGLLAAFPKLVGTGKQHTYVETENVRYVYQPLDALYLLLVTNKQSNILEDLETLRLLSKLVPEYCPGLDEESVCHMAFELIFAFDEVISLGHKENVTIAQVKQYTEMESAAEKQYKADLQSKINETKDLMKKKAQEIEKLRADKKVDRGGISGGLSGMGPGMGGPMSMNNGFDMGGRMGGGGGGGGGGFGGPMSSAPDTGRPGASLAAPSKGMGMKLGKTTKTNQFLESLKAEGEVIVEDLPPASAAAAAVFVPTDPITILIEEKLMVAWKRDGGLENMEVQGTMALTVLKEEDALIRIQIEGGRDKSFQFKTHPNIDKALYSSQNILGLKDPNRPFPTGSPLGILKWRMQSRDEAMVPISINCWPSVSGADTYVNIEYEATDAFDLQHVVVEIPMPALREAPVYKDYDGEPRYDSRRSVLEWCIDLIDNSNRNGSMEFVVPATNPDVFFPIEVRFTSAKTFCDVKVVSVTQTTNGQPAKFTGKTQMSVENYQVV
eukprot:TRINITY_DN39066_c0_g1_i1.p1 TRINITY_DN39066_c0_g1~~TRINITY_DN39066_c0_g1_i1.p1  ORF type:complete len:525 (-),score=64.80 TRINITY_DN39066_c0_g1_i1:429-2003(-)